LYRCVTDAVQFQLILTTRISSAEVSHVSLPTTPFNRLLLIVLPSCFALQPEVHHPLNALTLMPYQYLMKNPTMDLPMTP
jgi:hypothetical protein